MLAGHAHKDVLTLPLELNCRGLCIGQNHQRYSPGLWSHKLLPGFPPALVGRNVPCTNPVSGTEYIPWHGCLVHCRVESKLNPRLTREGVAAFQSLLLPP